MASLISSGGGRGTRGTAVPHPAAAGVEALLGGLLRHAPGLFAARRLLSLLIVPVCFTIMYSSLSCRRLPETGISHVPAPSRLTQLLPSTRPSEHARAASKPHPSREGCWHPCRRDTCGVLVGAGCWQESRRGTPQRDRPPRQRSTCLDNPCPPPPWPTSP